MWRMHDGDRVLTEAEWEVFATGLDLLRSQIETDVSAQSDDTDTGIAAFDRLTGEQKLALLAEVAHAVRDPAAPIPRHTAANEGAIMAVLDSFRDMLQSEVEENEAGRADLRRCLLGTFANEETHPEKLPRATSEDWEAWELLFEGVADRLLWDRDFELGDHFLDLPPNDAREKLRLAGIDSDYYLSAPPEPGEKGLTAARQTLARLLELPVPDDDGLYPSLSDLFHDLFVGPIPLDEIGTFDDHPWLRVVSAVEPSWDCDLPTWRAEFADLIPLIPFTVSPAGVEGGRSLPEDMRVERTDGGWAVRMADGSYWEGLVENGWTDTPDEDNPALTFPTEADAIAAFFQANQMYRERSERQQKAIERLDELDAFQDDEATT
ncbi:Uncharacterized protein OS=Singulisphaera acidiphila (strain ATCC BAA-1392 / DSM 18658 / VKM B-2454 / MOB10) GN=Sinac_1675 PE=4 SV=1 [Gemmata massiliana]|uniref:Uncharacterized protein n=1 Tax=Gemmata massiliana TaxID=1210884 RepID=A0A6P2DK60_9BACT|nr:hypothetical protein [Gemmata massiliana]VTS01902.1 Uncharacterized protein OS=Singulisphaera acidiphila (strain ATCC BAA-1392 / DSM 18658 / VKM B-2454 / MOB10) GN=Sinac_1675 PE=4 SV=1 [Gemmata massiliana]